MTPINKYHLNDHIIYKKYDSETDNWINLSGCIIEIDHIADPYKFFYRVYSESQYRRFLSVLGSDVNNEETDWVEESNIIVKI